MTLISGREVLSPSPKGHFPHHHHYHEESSSDDEFLIANDLLEDSEDLTGNNSSLPHDSPHADLLPFSLPQLGLNYLNNLNLLHNLPTPNLPNLGGIGITFPNLRNSPLWRIYENSGFHQKRAPSGPGGGGGGQGSGWFLSSYLSGKEDPGGDADPDHDDIISTDSRYFTFTNFLRRHGFPFNEEDYYSEEAILERVRFKQQQKQQKVKVQRSQSHQRTKLSQQQQRSQVKSEENERKEVVEEEEELKILKIEREAEKELSERLEKELIKEEEVKPKEAPEVEVVAPQVVEHVEKERVVLVEDKVEMKEKERTAHPNPFYNRVELTFWNKVKIGLLSVTLFPIKVVMMAVSLTVALLLVLIGMCGVTFEESQSRPFSKWRRCVRWVIANIVMRSFVFSAGFIWGIKETGKRAKPEEAPIFVVGPHSSYFDAFAVILLGAPSVVAKLSTKDIPVFGRLVTFTQAVYVSRESKGSRRQTMEVLKQRAQDVYHGNGMPQIFIFPEGTCANRSSLIKFKPGAFVPQVPVQPVLIRYPNNFDGCSWTFDGPPAARNIWYTFAQLFNRIEIEYLPVYVPNEEEKQDSALFAENVRKVMGKALQIPLSDYQFEDGTLLTTMREKKLVQKLRSIHRGKKALGLSGSTKEYEALLLQIPTNQSTTRHHQMDFFQFQREFFHVSSEDTVVPEVEAAFNSFKKEKLEKKGKNDKDTDKKGVVDAEEFLDAEIDIRPYLIFTCILYGDCVEIRDIPKMICQVYGADETQQEMRRLLDNLFNIGEGVDGAGSPSTDDEAQLRISRILDFAKLFADEVAERLPKNYPPREFRDKKSVVVKTEEKQESLSKLKLE